MLPITAYESSSDSEGSSDTEQQQSSSMPALPGFFSPASTKAEDPVKHQGRKRTKPHTANSWATHVYVQVPVTEEVKQIVGPTITDDIHSMIQQEEDEMLHVSLSRCVFLKEHQLDTFAQNIRDSIAQSSFCITFADVSVLTNDEKTRSFVTVEVGAGYNEADVTQNANQLQSLLRAVDKVMEKFGQPVFYKPARFHASIAWSLTSAPLEAAVGRIPTLAVDDLTTVSHMVSKVVVKMGNRVVEVPLQK
ncbi:U6 snRNA phosphodiesterase Usb1 [Zychaea mexicana]|uniref:U6 snRNA phosphodiesterase Usb1 n=1 Tax=Zychaea mexicana TaxID=64656 RepID=UPI0022FDDBE5|nr:U6 snRNA phosphodiesterase Usb1 [Zychaea mexicana]KAI9497318.1 U6 snRNA phosphodiesterase Usb1 [Zychaea mexicana]